MSSYPLIRTAAAALVAATAALGAGAATASADSLVYVKAHNVWLADDNGAAQHQVTTDGTAENPYMSPSQSDDGTIVAARKLPNGGPLIRLRQNGDTINQIPLAEMQFGPFDPAVSPDGSMVAYTRGFSRYVNGWLETGTDIRYTRTTGYTDPAAYPAVSTGATTPSWISSTQTFVGRGTVGFAQTPGSPAVQWWSDYDHYDHFGGGADLSDGEVAGGKLALVRANNGYSTIQFYGTGGDLAVKPSPTCTVSDPAGGPSGAVFADPTLSSDGRRAYWQEGDGIYRADMPAGDSCDGWTVRKLIDGATEPDWSPTAANPGPRSQAPAGPGATPPGRGAKPAPPGAGAAPRGCAARSGAARERCVYAATVAKCAKLGKRKRARCVTSARKVRAVAACKRTKQGKARKACVRRAKR